MAENAPSFGLLVFLVAVVVVAAGLGTYFVYAHGNPTPAAGSRTVGLGDNVTVNYIGMFGSGPQQGKVFDTSIRAVAENNLTYPKAFGYVPRNSSGYTALGVHVGPHSPSSGYSIGAVTYAGVVTGFWEGLLGLSVNETRWITVPPDLGYGPANGSCFRTVPIVQTIPSVVVLTPAQFATDYPGVQGLSGVAFVDPTYGWPDTILAANNSSVVVGLFPTVGEVTCAPGWPVQVTSVAAGTITLTNLLTSADVGTGGKVPNSIVCNTNAFVISSVNPNGTFTEDFNKNILGVTLLFQVTVVAFAPSA